VFHQDSSLFTTAMSNKGDTGKSYHLECTGDALETANAHSGEADLTLFGSCFCPFVQRVWVALEYFGIDYHVCRCFFFRDSY
jgi:glutathione S-transferase